MVCFHHKTPTGLHMLPDYTALPLQARNQMFHGMDWWTFGGADASIASTWFGFRHARLLSRCPWMYSGFEFWVLCFRVLGAPFSRLGCFVLWLLFLSASFSKLPFLNDINYLCYYTSSASGKRTRDLDILGEYYFYFKAFCYIHHYITNSRL